MRHLLLLLAIIATTLTTQAQTTHPGGPNQTTQYQGGIGADSAMAPPKVDTTKPQFLKGISKYQIAINILNGHFMYHDQFGWREVATSGTSPTSLAIGTDITGSTNTNALYVNGSGKLANASALTISTSGSSIGIAGGSLATLGFYGATPIVQPTGSIIAALNPSTGLGLVSGATITPSTDLTVTGTPGVTTFLRGDNTWSVPTASGVTTVNVTSPITTSGGSSPTIGLDQTAAYTWSGVHTFTNTLGNTIRCDGIGANQQAGITFVNSVVATSGVPNQIAEGFKFLQQTYNNSTSSTTGIWIQPSSTRSASNVRPRLDMSFTIDGAGWGKFLSFFRTSTTSQTVVVDSLFQIVVNPTTGFSSITNPGNITLAPYNSSPPTFQLASADGGGAFILQGFATGSTYTIVPPTTQGGANTTWVNDGSGNMSWKATGSMAHTIFTPTTGSTITLINNQYNIVNPAGAILALTVTLPSSPANNDYVYIKYAQAVTTVTYTGGTVVDGIVSPAAGGLVVLQYDSGTTSWY